MKELIRSAPLKRSLPIVISVGVVVLTTAIFIGRNLKFFTMPNFFVEDATVLFNDVYTRDPIGAILHAFNGYLIIGQYLLAYLAAGINFLLGNHLANLPVVTAIVACAFLGLTASLPFILFRKELGNWLALAIVLVTALVPMYSYDYAIIGSLSNLKFAFLYIAFLFVLYRFKKLSLWQYFLTDAILVLCVLTNAPAAFLVPFILLPYLQDWRKYVRIRLEREFLPVYSAIATVFITALYVLVTVIHGIPKMPGYMDAPFQIQSLLPVVDRTVFFAWFYPITSEINSYFVTILLLMTVVGGALLYRRLPKERWLLLFTVWTLFISTALLIMNRSGIGMYYLTYIHKGGPDQFFYAQNMVVIFVTGWLLRNRIGRLGIHGRWWLAAGLALYLSLGIPHGSSFGGSSVVYKEMKPVNYNLAKACKEYAGQPKVIIQIYPNTYWQWHVDRNLACKDQHS